MNKPYNIGRPTLIPFIVSVRAAGDTCWPLSDRMALIEAQTQHDMGLVNMCQGRAGHLIIQYAIPNAKPVHRLPYFNRQEVP